MFSRSIAVRQLARSSKYSFRSNSTQQKIQEKAGETASKAQEQAKAAASKASAAVSGAASRVSGLTSRIMGLQEPIVYWSKVTGQIAKQVYLKEGMSPPSAAHLEGTYKSLAKSFSAKELGNTFKGISSKDAIKLGVDGIVIYGFFVVGEMVGRRSLVGYDV